MMKKIMIAVILAFFGIMLFGCTKTTPTVLDYNSFYQTDYEYFCFDGNKTWSQIVVCLDAENKAEKTQNKITNDLLSQN